MAKLRVKQAKANLELANARLMELNAAVAIIFGLLLATILTLGVVPSLYLIYDRSKTRLSRTLNWRPVGEMDV